MDNEPQRTGAERPSSPEINTAANDSRAADTPSPAPAEGQQIILDADGLQQSKQSLLATQVTDPMDALIRASKHHPPPPSGSKSTAEQKTPTVLGDFRLVRKLGEGAMGIVYKATQISVAREVAIKVLFPHMAKNTKLLERFYREARVMGRLDHPNIVRGYAVGEEQGWHYFAMEFIDGRSLQKWLGLLGKLSIGDAMHIALACADALCYAHGIELVHRDIKPDNILITRTGEVKITDFGAVKLLDEDISLTQTGNGIGTPCYMPLEQARNAKEADGRSDIYALGSVLYCMLTGRPPFTGANLVELIQSKDAGRFTQARRLNSEVPERLDLILDKMIAKSVKYRYQTCPEVIRDLNSLHLASSSLSFVAGGSGVSTPLPRLPSKADDTPPVGNDSAAVTPQPGTITDWWYVCYKTPKGAITRKLTTAQVMELARDKNFDPMATASRSLTDGYRLLARYREFEHLLAGRATKTVTDLQTAKFRAQFQQLTREDQQSTTDSSSSAADWWTLLYKLAVIALCLAFSAVGIRLIIRMIADFPVKF
jgi:serine/threonine-protein kinase